MSERPHGEPAPKPARLGIAGLFFSLAGLILLNGLLTLHVWAPDLNLPGFFRPSPDFLAHFLLMFALARTRKGLFAAGVSLLSLAASFLFLFSMGEAVTLHVYGRSFLPLVDLGYFMEFIRLLFQAERTSESIVFAVLFGAFVSAVAAGIVLIVVRVTGYLRDSARPLAIGSILLGILTALTLAPLAYNGAARVPPPVTLAKSVYAAFSGEARSLPGGGPSPELSVEAGAAGARESPAAIGALPGAAFPPVGETRVEVPWRNVFLFIIESYGYTVFAKEDHWAILRPFYAEMEEKLRNAGYAMFTRFFKSPVIGGYSWYADASLLTGQWVGSKEKYDRLMASGAPSMFSVLGVKGYSTVLSAPGTLKPWPEGERFYGFDRYFYDASFEYRGPNFSFVPVPDQFSVHFIHERVVKQAAGRPLFILQTLVSSHAPFNRIPPYVGDWDRLGDGSIYRALPLLTFDNNWFQGNEYTEGYTAAIRYEITVLAEYLVRFISDESLIVIVGDHQPKHPVTEKGQPRSVPLHVLSRRGDILQPLRSAGFSAGLVADGAGPHPGLDAFFPLFLELVENSPRRPPHQNVAGGSSSPH